MPITIGYSIAGLRAQRELEKATSATSTAFERLSSGLRINRAADDAAGLALASSLRTDSRIFAKGIQNLNDGISLLSVADGGLEALSAIATRQLELAEQAANGTFSLQQRKAMHEEANALVIEWNRIIATTRFNGINVLDTSLISGLSIQAGSGANAVISSAVGQYLSRIVGTGATGSPTGYNSNANSFATTIVDLNGDGKNDLIVANDTSGTLSILLGNGDGTFLSPVSYATHSGTRGVVSADTNNDGKLDLIASNFSGASLSVLLGNADGTFRAPNTLSASGVSSYLTSAGDLNNDGKIDLVTGDSSSRLNVFLGNGDGTFLARRTYANGEAQNLVDFNGDGFLDAIGAFTANKVFISYGNGDGSFKASTSITASPNTRHTTVGDFNRDGLFDIATADETGHSYSLIFGRADGTVSSAVSFALGSTVNPAKVGTADFNLDGILDLWGSNGSSFIALGNGDGTFKLTSTAAHTGGFGAVGDLNGDGVEDFASSTGTTTSVHIMNTERTSTIKYLNLLTASSARNAIPELQANLDRVLQERGSLGAYQSRFHSALNVLGAMKVNTEEARARIEDVDVAGEVANLIRSQILQQTAAAVLAQNRLSASMVLRLLQ